MLWQNAFVWQDCIDKASICLMLWKILHLIGNTALIYFRLASFDIHTHMCIIHSGLLWLRRSFVPCSEGPSARVAFCNLKKLVLALLANTRQFGVNKHYYYQIIRDFLQASWTSHNIVCILETISYTEILWKERIFFASTNWVFSKLMVP